MTEKSIGDVTETIPEQTILEKITTKRNIIMHPVTYLLTYLQTCRRSNASEMSPALKKNDCKYGKSKLAGTIAGSVLDD